jgi:hypothetical protein
MPAGPVHPWLLLTYHIPREPSSGRVFVWRNLKQMGAVLLHDSVWVLPRLPWTRERFQWLASEIAQHGGEATIWEARLEVGDRRALIQQFLDRSTNAYLEILGDLEKQDADLDALQQRFEQVKNHDYFQSHLATRAAQALQAMRDRAERAEL